MQTPDDLESKEVDDESEADDTLVMKRRAVFETDAQPSLLEGEVVLASVERTLKFERLNERGTGSIGSLFVTNYKLSFQPAERSSYDTTTDDPPSLTNVSNPDIPLTSVGSMWTISSGSTGRRRLSHGVRQFIDVEQLEVQCKDFYQVNFSFKLSDKKETSQMLSILGVYAFPSSITRVFAFDYASALARKQPLSADVSGVPTFRSVRDFEEELSRLDSSKSWRVSSVNREFTLSESLPQLIVCPATCKDSDLLSAVMIHKHGRIPTWCWSRPETSIALARAACARSKRSKRSSVVQALGASSFSGKVNIVSLEKCCPTVRDVQTSFSKLQELCLVNSVKDWHNDAKWLSDLESTRWLSYVKCCLEVSLDIVKSLVDKSDSVLIEESDGRDLSCVIASLVQLIADPHYRTLKGLQGLIQKEWVVAGHRFMTRCDHLHSPNKPSLLSPQGMSMSMSLPRTVAVGNNVGDSTWYDNSSAVLAELMRAGSASPTKREMDFSILSEPAGRLDRTLPVKRSQSYATAGGSEDDSGSKFVMKRHCPIFVLFLDCVHQLMCQYPTAFEFSEFFLQHLWTTSYSCLYDSFLFDSEKMRLDMISRSNLMSGSGSTLLRMKSAWEGITISDNDKNPLYGVVGKESKFSWLLGIKPVGGNRKYLQPNLSVAALHFWSRCYLQWIPMAHDELGRHSSSSAIQRQVVNEIHWLLQRPGGQIALERGVVQNGSKSKSPSPGSDVAAVCDDQPANIRARAMTMPALRSEPWSKPNVSRVSYSSYLDDMSLRSLSMGNFAEEVFSMVEGSNSLGLRECGETQAVESSAHSTPKKEIDTQAVYV